MMLLGLVDEEIFITAIPNTEGNVPVHPGRGEEEGAIVAVTACGRAIGDA